MKFNYIFIYFSYKCIKIEKQQEINHIDWKSNIYMSNII